MKQQENKAILVKQCEATRNAAKKVAHSDKHKRDEVLLNMAGQLHANRAQILASNQVDRDKAKCNGMSDAMLDRLLITESGIEQMQTSLRLVAELADPLTRQLPQTTRPNGIKVSKKAIPLGVILMIYESRPNVTVEAGALALKSGNGIILRGGSEAFESNQALARCWQQALEQAGFDAAAVSVLASCDRELVDQLLKLDDYIDLVIPRGGEGLIRHVVKNSYIPVIKHYKGICHLYVDEYADLDMAIRLLINGKTQRPGVCNALEGVVVHQAIATRFLPLMYQALSQKGVTIYGCEQTRDRLPQVERAGDKEFLTEFLDLKICCKQVSTIDAAIDFIDQYGSGHTEVIVTESFGNAQRFVEAVDASVVMVNASSRFSDGGELGLGAEIGISTSKIHAYGPMGLESLTSEKFVVNGTGQTR